MSSQQPSPIIIYGAPRSGTTYLNKILNRHPEVFISEEARIFLWLHESLQVLPRNNELVWTHRKEFVAHLRGAFPPLIRDFYRALHPHARYWGDKYPHYASEQHAGCLDLIVALFPQTRFIHIIRDGRDVVASLLRKRHPDGRPWVDFEGAHRKWTTDVERGCAFGRSLPPARYFELRYEELIRDDEALARRLFEHLGIEIHDLVVNFCREQQRVRTPFCEPTRDLRAGVGGSDWQQVLDPRQQLRSLELLGSHLMSYGYETSASLPAVYHEAAERCAQEITKSAAARPERYWQPEAAENAAPLNQPLCRIVQRTVPSGATVLIVSKGDDDLLRLDGRRGWHFPQTEDGTYAGHHPADGGAAIEHLEALRAKGAAFLVFPSPSLWWLDYYQAFCRHLDGRYRRVWQDGTCVIYHLANAEAPVGAP
jgi:hypothetical protein